MAAITGQITVTTAGTAVQGPDVPNTQGQFFLKALPTNTGIIYYGNDGAGDVTSANGYPLSPGDQLGVTETNLNSVWFDASVSGDKVAWLKG